MKRTRENGIPGPQPAKRSTSFRGEMAIPEPPPSVPPTGQRLTTDDALQYLKAVKDMFKDDKDKYEEFLEVMKDFKAQRIDTAGVITRVKDLFKGHRQLILGFNAFLPKGYEITLPAKEEHLPKKQPVEFDQAINYVNKIKMRFQNDEQVYKAFLEILNMYRKGNKSITEVYQEVAALFTHHADLVEEFTYFLPDSSAPVSSITTARPVSHTPSRAEEKPSGALSQARQMPPERLVKREKGIASLADRDRASERDGTLERVSSKVEKEQRKRSDKEKEKKDDSERREKDKAAAKDADEGKEKDLDASQRLPHKRKSARRADELIRKQSISQAVDGGEALQGQSASPLPDEEKKVSRNSALQKEQLLFFDKVKGRLRNRDTYQEFLKCLNIFNQEIIGRAELQSLVADILGKHSDLMDGFNDFLSRRENLEGCLANVFSNNKKLDFVEVKPKVEKDKEVEKEQKDWELEPQVEQQQPDQGREKEKDRARFTASKEAVPCAKASSILNKEKYSNKPISELDLSNSEHTPSYRLLSKSYPKPSTTHRTDLARGVLNDNWVSVTSGSEDYSFKHMRKNQYEESLFRCEDDRFELDMLVESASVTAKRVADLVDAIQEPSFKQGPALMLDEQLSALNLRCIERIYGDHGLDVIDLLRKNASIALPVILARLRQKHEEWSRCRSEMNKVWAEVYSKNYHKSLDHRSFYFKQQDKKSLSTKSLIAEIKDISEKKRREGSAAVAVITGNRRPIVPELRFEYADPSVHEDVYQIIKSSLEEVCSTTENSEKIIRIWSRFFEPMFGVPARVQGAEDREEAKALPTERKGSSVNGELSGILADVYELETRGHQTHFGETAKQDPEGVAQAASTDPAVPMEMESEGGAVGFDEMKASREESFRQEGGLVKNDGHGTKQVAGRKLEGSNASSKGHQETEKQVETVAAKYGAEAVSYALPSTLPKDAVSLGAPFLSSASKNAMHEAEGNSDPTSDVRLASVEIHERISTEKGGDTRPSHRHRSEGLSNRNVGDVNVGTSTRTEREEGEMSPSPDLEDRSDSKYGHGHSLTIVSSKYKIRDGMESNLRSHSSGHQHEVDESEGNGDADDEGEESANENMSEDGDISDNDSGDGDDPSQDDHDDEEDDEEAGQEGKAESEGEAEGDLDQNHGERDRISWAPSSDHSFANCKPLAAYSGTADLSAQAQNSSVVYGNDTFYVIFRLHQTLYERILSAKKNAMANEQKWRATKDTTPPNFYAKFMRVLYSLLDGSTDNAKFEDECRTIIGTQSYILFTLDKLIFKLVKQLQAAASDDTLNKLLVLHAYEKSRGPGQFIDLVYFANAAVLLHDDNIYRFAHKFNSSACVVQLMEGTNEKYEISATALEFAFSSYLNNFLVSGVDDKDCHRVFLPRNKRKVIGAEEGGSEMKNVVVLNGLEYKISCNTSKVSYVFDTEDFFHRRRAHRRSATGARAHSRESDNGGAVQGHRKNKSRSRSQRFHRWYHEVTTDFPTDIPFTSFGKGRSK